jgi:hypothetical protein
MGDRCWVRIFYHETQASAVYECMGCEPDDEDYHDNHWFSGDWSEMSYGASSERELMRERGVQHWGYHQEGGEYGPCCFAFQPGRKPAECDANMDGQPMITVNDDGHLEPVDIRRTREFLSLKALIYELPPPSEEEIFEHIMGDDPPGEALT